MTKKLKIAVQFYGHLRTFEQTYKSVQENLFESYDCDVFIHTWDELQHRTATWYDQGKDNCIPVDDSCIAKVNEVYSPKKIMIEKQALPEKDDKVLKSHLISDSVMSLKGITHLFYSQYMVNKLRLDYEKQTGTVYDYVIVIRPDVLLHRPLNIEEFAVQQQFISGNIDNCRFCANNTNSDSTMPIKLRNMCATDILYFGKPDVITSTTSFYEIIKDNENLLIDNFSNPEGFVYKHNKDNNIEMVLICFTDDGVDWSKIRFQQNTSKKKKSKLISKIITLHVRKNKLDLYLLPKVLPRILRFKFQLGGIYKIDIALGKIKD